jgi:hypothetical protein
MKTVLGFAIAMILFFNVPGAWSQTPEGFSILADRSGITVPADVKPVRQQYDSPWQPTSEDRQRGFAVYNVDTLTDLTPDWVWGNSAPSRSIALFSGPEQYKSAAMAIRILRPVKKLQPQMTDLRDAQGRTIAAVNVDFRLVQSLPEQKNNQMVWGRGNWLEKFSPTDLPAEWTAWVWVTFYVPKGTPAGTYQGSMTIRDEEEKSVSIPVCFTVLDFTPPRPAGSWGMFVTGHFYGPDQGIYHNYGYSEQWNPENLPLYLRFYKSHGFNSIIMYGIYPDLKCINGHAVVDFPTVRQAAKAMKEVGLDGELGIDLRWIEFWSGVASVKIRDLRKQGKPLTGDLGVYGPDGSEDARLAFNDEAKRLFRESVSQLLAMAKQEDWPRIRLMVEEELWTVSLKTETYDQFMPELLKLAPDRAFLVDNAIGYGSEEAIDRGARDKLNVREYNNWTEKGLADARRDGAEIWSYNLGNLRAAWGLYQQRIGSKGYHQWADQWGKRRGQPNDTVYTYTLITPTGMISSVPIERSREGLDDYAYFHMLDTLANQLEEKGMSAEAKRARKVLADIVGPVSINRYAFFDWQAALSGDQLDQYRWQVVLAIQEARKKLGLSVKEFNQAAPGTPALRAIVSKQTQSKQSDKILYVPRLAGAVTLNGKIEESCWRSNRNSTGELWWIGEVESNLRAKAGNADEAKNLPHPSSSQVQVAYDDRGLYLLVQCNHSTQENALAKHGDDDYDLWQDDCMEFFFQPGKVNDSNYHLIVNVKGRRVLLTTGSNKVKDSGIATATVSPTNASGGYSQEIFVPWKSLGLAESPAPGTAWKFNACRAFNSWRQLMTWAPVYRMFAEKDKWGTLLFEGTEGRVWLENFDLGSRYPGHNRIKGQLAAAPSVEDTVLTVVLADEKDQPIAQEKILRSGKDPVPLELTYTVPVYKQAVNWRVKYLDAKGNVLGELTLPVPSAENVVGIDHCPTQIVGGMSMEMEINLHLGDLSVNNRRLTGTLVFPGGRRISLNTIAFNSTGPQRLWLDTAGLEPGKWTLFFRVVPVEISEKETSVSFEVLPSYITGNKE